MEPLLRDVLTFTAPGIAHRLGNDLFAIHGQAQLLDDPGDAAAGRAAILHAAAQGARVLALLRVLTGESVPQREDPGALLATAASVLGVPLRERGLRVEADRGEAGRGVDPRVFCPAVLEGVRLLAGMVPPGQPGVVTLALADGDGVVVAVRFVAGAGTLPFPLAVHELRSGLQRALHGLRPAPRVLACRNGIELAFAADAAVVEELQA